MEFPTEDVTVGPYTVSIIRDDQYIGNTLRRGYEWDGWMHRDLPYIYKPGTDILDIGGNIGWNALMFSNYGPVHTFEPVFHKVISKNVTQNSLKHPVEIHPYGLSSKFCPEIKMFTPRREGGLVNYGGASLDPDPRWYDATEEGYVTRLEKLDDVYHGTPSVIKLDVERHELEVIQGALETITKHKPAMYIEILDPKNDEIVKMLEPLGYVMCERPENNYLFICQNSPN
jgi:FkbM family methyltransferase